MKKIKVAFFADTLLKDIDGAVRTMYQIIERIPEDQFEFLFIVGQKPVHDFPHRVIEVPTMTIPFNPNYKIAVSAFSKTRLDEELMAFKPDIIHISTPSMIGNYALTFAERHNIRTVTIYHTHFLSYIDYYLRSFPFLISKSKKLMIAHMQNFYNRCDTIYVPSQSMIDELTSIGVLSNNMVLWKRGLDQSKFNPSKKLQNYRGYNNSVFKILFASRLVWEKNLVTLQEIYRQSEAMGLPYQFIIAGAGCARKALEESMPHADFLGELNQDELGHAYASSDVFVFPSISETYGNVVVEAMACGLPCVIAKGGGTNDFVIHEKTGLICSPNDSSAYINGIERIRNDHFFRNKIVHKGLEYSSGMSWETLVDKYFTDLGAQTLINSKLVA